MSGERPETRPIHDPTAEDRGGHADRAAAGLVEDPNGWTSGWSTVVAGGVFLSSGLALVAHVLLGVPLPLVFAAAIVGAGVIGALLHRDAPVTWWGRHRRLLWIGLVAGVVSTAAYDLSRWLLVLVGELPSSPYAAFPFFGRAIVGEGAPATLAQWVGTGFHFLNGIAFAIAYTIWFGRRSWWWGIAFGLGLEAFMLAIYPGWLDIRAIGEFTSISVVGHVCYGAVLGGMVAWLRR